MLILNISKEKTTNLCCNRVFFAYSQKCYMERDSRQILEDCKQNINKLESETNVALQNLRNKLEKPENAQTTFNNDKSFEEISANPDYPFTHKTPPFIFEKVNDTELSRPSYLKTRLNECLENCKDFFIKLTLTKNEILLWRAKPKSVGNLEKTHEKNCANIYQRVVGENNQLPTPDNSKVNPDLASFF